MSSSFLLSPSCLAKLQSFSAAKKVIYLLWRWIGNSFASRTVCVRACVCVLSNCVTVSKQTLPKWEIRTDREVSQHANPVLMMTQRPLMRTEYWNQNNFAGSVHVLVFPKTCATQSVMRAIVLVYSFPSIVQGHANNLLIWLLISPVLTHDLPSGLSPFLRPDILGINLLLETLGIH